MACKRGGTMLRPPNWAGTSSNTNISALVPSRGRVFGDAVYHPKHQSPLEKAPRVELAPCAGNLREGVGSMYIHTPGTAELLSAFPLPGTYFQGLKCRLVDLWSFIHTRLIRRLAPSVVEIKSCLRRYVYTCLSRKSGFRVQSIFVVTERVQCHNTGHKYVRMYIHN